MQNISASTEANNALVEGKTREESISSNFTMTETSCPSWWVLLNLVQLSQSIGFHVVRMTSSAIPHSSRRHILIIL